VAEAPILRTVLPLAALLAGSAFLLFAGGINALILPIRGQIEGFSATALGLLGTGWAIGYVAGCLRTPALVARVGHVRAFGAMCAIAAITILLSLLILSPWVWVALRALSGFCFAGAAMIVESWLNERAEPAQRGRLFGVYTTVNLAATTAGQLVLTLGDPAGYLFFVLAAIFYCLALLPTAISASQAPTPLVSARLDIPGLWRNSPIAVAGVLMIGVSNAAFGTLGAVYALRIGLSLRDVALFASLPILAGALAQLPVGALSDRFDRRRVLVGIALVALAADGLFLFAAPAGSHANLALATLFGAAIFSMYPVIVAHANDHAAPGEHIRISGGLLLMFGLGSIVGPALAGVAMAQNAPASLFAVSAVAHLALIVFALIRMATRAPVAAADKGTFVAAPLARATTPETAALASEEAPDRD
jgi:MFS family permease